jgi:hypothetical protein
MASGILSPMIRPLNKQSEAVALMQTFGYEDIGLCKVCKP